MAKGARSLRGLSLIEVLMASAISVVLLGTLYLVFSSSLKSFAWASASGQTQAEFLTLREYLGRDIQQAGTLIDEVRLDGVTYRTPTQPPADSLVLRLPAVNDQGDLLPGVYDFALYTIEAMPRVGACLRRRLVTTRAANGDPLIGALESSRIPDEAILLRGIVPSHGQGLDGGTPRFLLHPPVTAVAREVELSVTVQPSLPSTGRMPPQTYTTIFRLRNASS